MNGTSKIMSELDQATLKRHNMRLLGPNLELYFWPFLTRGLHGDTQSPCSRAKKKRAYNISLHELEDISMENLEMALTVHF